MISGSREILCLPPDGVKKIPHQTGITCREEEGPKCESRMMKEVFYHHQLIGEKRKGEEVNMTELKDDCVKTCKRNTCTHG